MLIKRIVRYLQGKPQVAIRYGFQDPGQDVIVLTDSDWAGCVETRRSTSGGVVKHGWHIITWWCKLQSRVALSSCDAELNSTLKGAIEGLNVQRLANAFNDWPNLELRTDASAARGVILRQGVGKVRHLHVKQLWIQDAVAAGELIVVKIPRAQKCSDALTHAWTAADLEFWSEMGLRFSPSAHQVSSSSSRSSAQGPVLQLLCLDTESPWSPARGSTSTSTTTSTLRPAEQWAGAKLLRPGNAPGTRRGAGSALALPVPGQPGTQREEPSGATGPARRVACSDRNHLNSIKHVSETSASLPISPGVVPARVLVRG